MSSYNWLKKLDNLNKMKTIRIVYITWRGIEMRCTLTQVKSIPQSDIDVDIRAVNFSDSGLEFCGCIIHDNLPNVIQTTIPANKTTLLHMSVPINHEKFYFAHKKVMREEWRDVLLELVNDTACSNIEQHTLF